MMGEKIMARKRAIIISLVAVLIIIPSLIIYAASVTRYVSGAVLDAMELDEVRNIMIVAHPDDESIWAGGELIKEDYFVVCLMYGKHSVRSREFAAAMKITGDKFMMLNYNKSAKNLLLRWKDAYRLAEKDIEELLRFKDWDKIVTHNEEGEYGHQRHKDLSQIVTKICKRQNLTPKLYNFGKYYTKEELLEVCEYLPTLDEEIYEQKLRLLEVYASQMEISLKKYIHMARYEALSKYE